ncbi:hypothetical protein WKK05_05095 [Nostoc sp. UHCC 0302]|uniref:hypothetical protein n=1 Tax=Nostoc sp. UHCC 0302 TaxID=3134896 RepID=UPI00311CC318
MKGKTCYLASLIGITALVINATPAVAVELVYSSPGNVSKIQGLVVDGINYDVTFKYDSFLNIFGSPNSSSFNKPTFWDNSQTAQKVVDNIASLLNSQKTVPTKINNYPSALVAYRGVVASDGSLFIVSKIDNYITRWDNFRGESQDIFTQGNEQANYAIFSVQEPSKPVPEANFETGAVVAFLLGGASTLKKYGEKVKGKGARE